MRRIDQVLCLGVGCLAAAGCDASGIGAAFNLFVPKVALVIQNDTNYTAVPEIRTGGGRNIIEDAFEGTHEVTGIGVGGAVPPRQTVTFFLPCDDDTEMVAFMGAQFRQGTDLGVGDIKTDRRLRKGVDFDCGDTIRITLTGQISRFRNEVEVQRAPAAGSPHSTDSADDELADTLDAIFGGG